MNRRRYLATVAGGTLAATAGCAEMIETADEMLETADEMLPEDDAVAREDVYQSPESLTFDASAGEIIRVTVNIRNEGSRRGAMTLYGPNEEEVDSKSFYMDDESRNKSWKTFDAAGDGEHRVHVNPRGDQRARLRVSVTVSEN